MLKANSKMFHDLCEEGIKGGIEYKLLRQEERMENESNRFIK